LSILFFALKPIVKKLFNIKMAIDSQNRKRKSIGHRKLPRRNLRKGILRDYETGFCSPLALTVLEKIFEDLAMFFGFRPKFDLEISQGQIL
jgi:hypothetical protein